MGFNLGVFNLRSRIMLFCSTATISALGAIMTSLNDGNNDNIIAFDGSSSMRGLLGNILENHTDPELQFNISNSGSSTAINRVLNNNLDFALVSGDISRAREENRANWNSLKIKSVPVALDSLLIVYKPPEGCNKDLIIGGDNIAMLYHAFLGEYKYPLQKLLDDKNDDKCLTWLRPHAKRGGVGKSSIAQSFLDSSYLRGNGNGKIEWRIISHLMNGLIKGGKHLNFLPESNVHSLEMLRGNPQEGSIAYFPGSFVFQNWSTFQKLGFKVAGYKDENNQTQSIGNEAYKGNEFWKKYPWIRAYYVVYSKNRISEDYSPKKHEFIKWMINSTGSLKNMNLRTLGVDNFDLKKDDSEEEPKDLKSLIDMATSEAKNSQTSKS